MEDFYLLETQLTAGEKMAKESVRAFVEKEVMPHIGKAFEEGVFPKEWIKGLAELGLFGITLPESVGGLGASALTYGLVCQELERGDSGLRSFVSVQNSLCMYPIFEFGNADQHTRYLKKMISGETIGCFGLTEPDVGSDPANIKTTAKKGDGGWILNGSKLWITNASIADIAIVWAQTDKGIRGFIVEKDFEGFSTHDIHHKYSLRASNTGELVFDNCFVPDQNVLPGSDKGLVAVLACLTQARYGIAWGAIGAAMSCFEAAVDYAKNRKQFGKPIAAFQLIQKDLADMITEITKAQCLNYQLARLKDLGQAQFARISMAKMNACQQALNIARSARNILGANGISLEYPVIRHMANLEAVFTYEGTDNMHHLIIGKEITGEDAFG